MRSTAVFIALVACAHAPSSPPIAPAVAAAPPRVHVPPPPLPAPIVEPDPLPAFAAPPAPVPPVCETPIRLGRRLPRTGVIVDAVEVAPAPAAADPRLVTIGHALLRAGFSGDVTVPTVVIARSTDGAATWSAPTRLDLPADCDGLVDCPLDPQLVAGGGLVYALYAGDAIGVRVRTSRDQGATFGASVLALGGTVAGAAIGPDSRLHVAAVRGAPLGIYGAADHVLEYAASSDRGAHFTAPVRVSARDDELPLVQARPAIAIDAARRLIYVVYLRGGRDLAWDVVVATSKDRGATWKRTAVTPPGCALRLAPAAAVDPATGALHVAWFDSRGLVGHARCEPGAARCTELDQLSTGDIDTSFDVGHQAALAIDPRHRTLRATWTIGDAVWQTTVPLQVARAR